MGEGLGNRMAEEQKKEDNISIAPEEVSLRLAFRLKEQEQIDQFNADREFALRLDRELNGQEPAAPVQPAFEPPPYNHNNVSPTREDLDYMAGAPPRPLGVHEHYPGEVQIPRLYQAPAQPAHQPAIVPAFPAQPVYQPPAQPAYQPPAPAQPAYQPPATNTRTQNNTAPANHSAILDDDDFNWSLS